MLSTIIITVLCILAVYGLMRLIFSVMLLTKGQPDSKQIHTVVMFKNNEEEVEGEIRLLVWARAVSGAESIGRIVAVDLGSKDDTLPILRRLEREYEDIWVMEKWEYEEYISRKG